MNMMTVADASDFIRGITFKPHELIDASDPDAIVCMRTKNIQADLDQRDLIAVPSRLVRQEQKLLRAGDILISSANSWELVGKCSYVPELPYRATAGGFIAIVRPKPKTHPRFLYHWLNSPATQHVIRNMGRQTTNISNLDVNRFKDIELPAFDFDEQRRIATILDKADAIRRKRERALALADDFLRSVFLEMFGDPLDNPYGFSRERIGDHLSKTRAGTQSGPFGSALKKHEYTDYGVPVWGVENVQPNRFKGEARLFISNEKYDDLRRYNVVRGDILISRAGTVGRMCVAEPACDQSIISTNLVRVSLDHSKLLPEYFVCLFTYFADRLSALKANNKDDAFTFLNPKTLREIKIPIPEIARQRNFVRLTRKLDGLLATAQDQRDGLSDLFSSLSQRAFRGGL